MLLEVGTTAAYSPPPALYERTDQLGSDSSQLQRPILPTDTSGTTETSLVIAAQDPAQQYAAQRAAKHDTYRQLNAQVEARVRELFIDSLLADEPFSQDSLADLRLFLRQVPFGRRPAIYLLDNGNLRAVWKNAENEQVALQFRGVGIVHCVFFLKRESPQLPLSRETLIDVIPKARARLTDFEHVLQ